MGSITSKIAGEEREAVQAAQYRADKINRRVLAAREGGNVLRCHTVPHHGQYSVGKHSYDSLSLLLLLHPEPSMNLVKAVLWHDCAERFVGDMPAPAKWLNQALGEEYEKAEREAQEASGLALPDLTEEEQNWLTAVDRVELLLWAEEQSALGNRHIQGLMTASWGWLAQNAAKVPQEVRDFVEGFVWRRLDNDPRN